MNKLILASIVLVSFQASASKTPIFTCQTWGIHGVVCSVNGDFEACDQCVKAHASCLLVTLNDEAVVAADVEACNTVEHSCLITNQCRDKQ